MHTVDPEFKISYDLRNDQEANVVAKQHARTGRDAPALVEATCPMFGSDGMKWVSLAALALLGLGVGARLGGDQYRRAANTK